MDASNTFGLSKRTFKALIQTNRAIANLCSDLLSDGYYYILTGRLQNDPLERRSPNIARCLVADF